MKTKVLLVDDHKVLRTGLRYLLDQQPDIEVVGEAGNSSEALDKVSEHSPNVIIMDMNLPGENGLKISKKILSKWTDIRIVVLSAFLDLVLVEEALQTGILGYVLKCNSHDEILRAIRMAIEGKMYVDPELNALILQEYKKHLSSRTSPASSILSDREAHILKLIADGMRNKEIADNLDISPKSVETYKCRIMKKLGFKNTAELIRYSIEKGLTNRT